MQDHRRRSKPSNTSGYTFEHDWLAAPKIKFSETNPFDIERKEGASRNDAHGHSEYRGHRGSGVVGHRTNYEDSREMLDTMDANYKRGNQTLENERRLSEYREKLLGEITSYMKNQCDENGGHRVHEKGDNSRRKSYDNSYLPKEMYHRDSISEHGYQKSKVNSYLDFMHSDRSSASMDRNIVHIDSNNIDEFFIPSESSDRCREGERARKGDDRASRHRTRQSSVWPIQQPVMTVQSLLVNNEKKERARSDSYETMDVDKKKTDAALDLLYQNDLFMSIQETGDASTVQPGIVLLLLYPSKQCWFVLGGGGYRNQPVSLSIFLISATPSIILVRQNNPWRPFKGGN